GYLRDVVERIAPAVFEARRDPEAGYEDIVIENVRQAATAIREKSAAVNRAIHEGRTAIVGGLYNLAEGTVTPVHTEGRITAHCPEPRAGSKATGRTRAVRRRSSVLRRRPGRPRARAGGPARAARPRPRARRGGCGPRASRTGRSRGPRPPPPGPAVPPRPRSGTCPRS